jgi:hypothetical protein
MIKNIFLMAAFAITACSRTPSDVCQGLRASGHNRTEFEKVLNHYKASGDKEKLRAAWFLVGNMDNKYALDGEAVRKYDRIFDILSSLNAGKVFVSQNSPFMKAKWDSLVSIYGQPSVYEADVLPDCRHITADYLIDNIDQSFRLRDEMPWGRKISFNDFCEHVLAYRFRHEPLEPWRKILFERYISLRDSVKADSIVQLGRTLQAKIHLNARTSNIFQSYPFDIPLSKMDIGRHGACPQLVIYNAMVMRAQGLPVTIDYAPLWGNHSSGHKWNALILENGNTFPFEGTAGKFGSDMVYKIAKVFRETYSRQHTGLSGKEKDIPDEFFNNYRIDVTGGYTTVFSVEIPLRYAPLIKKKHAVICTFDNNQWRAQDWGKIRNGEAIFKNIGAGNVYCTMYYENGSLSIANDPFILTEKGKVIFLSPATSAVQDMLLLRKYPCHKWTQRYHDEMVDGAFQGANKPDFSDSVNLSVVITPPAKFESVLVNESRKFRYVRYKSPYAGKSNVAELEFYGGDKATDTLKLNGKVIGFPEVSRMIGKPYQNAFDGKLETYFDGYTSGPAWAGLDLGIPKRITKIKYCPRSDTNFILVGDTYELCYWEKDGWVSLGRRLAKEQLLRYNNVPQGRLYLLHNLSRGREERPFTYEEGKQVFW